MLWYQYTRFHTIHYGTKLDKLKFGAAQGGGRLAASTWQLHDSIKTRVGTPRCTGVPPLHAASVLHVTRPDWRNRC